METIRLKYSGSSLLPFVVNACHHDLKAHVDNVFGWFSNALLIYGFLYTSHSNDNPSTKLTTDSHSTAK